ncbi:MAG: hypothetical protein OXI13_04075 [Gammaproteobacteria bacterium]|nr:hypothetical protein [Gammaproteobacteria bacterium]
MTEKQFLFTFPETFPDFEFMKKRDSKSRAPNRVARHRKAVRASGGKRVEVTVPANDAGLIKAVAGVLRSGGENATLVRQRLRPMLATSKARTGKELVEFLRRSPLADVTLEIERDRSVGRVADFD